MILILQAEEDGDVNYLSRKMGSVISLLSGPRSDETEHPQPQEPVATEPISGVLRGARAHMSLVIPRTAPLRPRCLDFPLAAVERSGALWRDISRPYSSDYCGPQ